MSINNRNQTCGTSSGGIISGMWWVVVLLVCPAVAQQPVDRSVFTGRYGSTVEEHHRFGRDVGHTFAVSIGSTLSASRQSGTLSIIMPFIRTAAGHSNYTAMLKTHNTTFPHYVAEIVGMAEGAGVSFDDLFSLNLGESLSIIADPYRAVEQRAVEHCSDYTLWPYNAHNEDGGMGDMNTSYWVDVEIDGANFSALVYCGQLPSSGFGWNSNAMAFTLNYVTPHDVDVHGMGRNFISRDLLRANDMADAVRRVTTAHPHATGHNYQLMSFREKLLTNIEAAPRGLFKVTPFDSKTPASFHANSYIHIKLPQYESESSKHRLARAATLPVPETPAQMLSVLGDQADEVQPIFHDTGSDDRGDQSGLITLTTVLFDMANGTVTEYYGNPKHLQIMNGWRL